MKNKIILSFLLFANFVFAQAPTKVLPKNFPIGVPDDNDATYSQENGVSEKIPFSAQKSYFGLKVGQNIIGYVPTASNNPVSDRNKIVKCSLNQKVYLIDALGNGMDLTSGAAIPKNENFATANLVADSSRTHNFGYHNLVITKKLSTTSSSESAIALTDGAYMYSQDTAGIKTGWLNLKNGDAKLTAVDYSDLTQRYLNVGQDAFYLKDKTDNTNKYLKILDNTGKIDFVDAPKAKLRAGEGISIKNDTIINLGAGAKTSTPNLNSKRYIYYNIQDSAQAGLHFVKSNATEFEVGYPIVFEGTDNNGEDRNTEILFKMKSSSGDSVTHKIAANSAALLFHSGKDLVFSGAGYTNMNGAGVNMSNTSTGFGLLSENQTNSTPTKRMRIGNINTLNTTSIQFGDNNIDFVGLPSATASNTHVLTGSSIGAGLSMKSIATISQNLGNTDLTLAGTRIFNLSDKKLTFEGAGVGGNLSVPQFHIKPYTWIDKLYSSNFQAGSFFANDNYNYLSSGSSTHQNTIESTNGGQTRFLFDAGSVIFNQTGAGFNNAGKVLGLGANNELTFVNQSTGGIANLVGGEGVEITNSNVVNLGAAAIPATANLTTKRYVKHTPGAGLHFIKSNNTTPSSPLIFEGEDDSDDENINIEFRTKENGTSSVLTHWISAGHNTGLTLNSPNNVSIKSYATANIFSNNDISVYANKKLNFNNTQFGIDILDPALTTADNKMIVGSKINGAFLSAPRLQFGNTDLKIKNLPSAITATHILTKNANDEVKVVPVASIIPATTNALIFQNGQLISTVNNVQASVTAPFSPFSISSNDIFVSAIANAQQPNVRMAIGKLIPTEMLDVEGKTKTVNFQMTNGALNGSVMTSDASGNASWANMQLQNIVHTATVTWLNNPPVVYSATDPSNSYNFTRVGNTVHFSLRIQIGNIQPNTTTNGRIVLPHSSIGSLIATMQGDFPSSATATQLDFVQEGGCSVVYPTFGNGVLSFTFISTAPAQNCNPGCQANIGYLNFQGSYKIV